MTTAQQPAQAAQGAQGAQPAEPQLYTVVQAVCEGFLVSIHLDVNPRNLAPALRKLKTLGIEPAPVGTPAQGAQGNGKQPRETREGYVQGLVFPSQTETRRPLCKFLLIADGQTTANACVWNNKVMQRFEMQRVAEGTRIAVQGHEKVNGRHIDFTVEDFEVIR